MLLQVAMPTFARDPITGVEDRRDKARSAASSGLGCLLRRATTLVASEVSVPQAVPLSENWKAHRRVPGLGDRPHRLAPRPPEMAKAGGGLARREQKFQLDTRV